LFIFFQKSLEVEPAQITFYIMLSSYLFALAIAGTATAATPKAFEPASTNDLTVAFGTTLATNGVNIPRASKQSPSYLL
jgi:hypothetical protein